MAKYYYEAWTWIQGFRWSSESVIIHDNLVADYCISGKESYEISPSGTIYDPNAAGFIRPSGKDKEYCPTSQSRGFSVYTTFSTGRIRRYRIKSYNGSVSMNVEVSDLILKKSGLAVEKGDNLVKTVIAEDGTYPNNGYDASSGYYWVKKGLANTEPTIEVLSPNQGDVMNTLAHSYLFKLFDAEGDDMQVYIQVSNNESFTDLDFNMFMTATYNNGEVRIRPNTHLKTSGTKYARFRVREVGGAWGEWTPVVRFEVNRIPTITLNTQNNVTLYENDTFKIDGNAKDTDIGDIVNVYYRINGGTSRAIATGISTGASIPFNEQLTFKGGVLYKGAVAITGPLTEGTAHRLEVWGEDNKGGKSVIAERTFYVVPNRAPSLTIDPFTSLAGMINNDKITISGESFDLDGNDVKVAYKLNTNAAVQIHSGPAGAWSFDLSLASLKEGENTIVVEVTDTYNFKSSKTIKLNKHANLTPLASSVVRYKITLPSGSAKGVLLWIQRDEGQVVSAEISMTTGSEQEQFVPMTLSNTAPITPIEAGIVEDEFIHQASAEKENIMLKLNLSNDKPITLITGVLS